MKNATTLLAALASTAFASVSLAAPLSAGEMDSRAAAIGNLMQEWQARILAFNLPVEDRQNWSGRNMARFGRLSADRLALAQRAGTLAELELAVIEAPVGEGSRLDVLLATRRGDMTLVPAGAKASPATSPGSYAGMVFTALSPCRILDSRVSQGGTGAWTANSTRLIKIGPYSTAGGGYATGAGAQGGSATSCGLDTLAGPGQVAMIMAAVSTVSQAAAGYLTFFSNGAPNPGLTSVSQWYQPGYVQTSFVVIPTDLIGSVAAQGFTSASTDLIIDIVGYFAPAVTAANLSLVNSTATTGNILKGGNRFIHNYGLDNTFIGVDAGNFTTAGGQNVASGTGALFANTGGGYNTATGAYALTTNTSGYTNTAMGAFALGLNSTGYDNTATGSSALYNNTTGFSNTANGRDALYNNTTGNGNTATGLYALYTNTTGGANIAYGGYALYKTTTGCCNTALGVNALYNITSTTGNTAVGLDALYNATGSANIALGNSAGSAIQGGNFNIAIGNNGTATDVGVIRIGSGHTSAFIAGIRGVATANANAVPVVIDSAGQLGTVSSSRRFKDDIADMDAASSALLKLRPVTFHYKSDRNAEGRTLQYGLVAEEVAEVYPGLVAHSADGQVETVMYQYLPSMLLNEYQKQNRRIEAQAMHIAALERGRLAQIAEIAGLKASVAEIAELKHHLAHLARLLDEQRNGRVTAGLDVK